MTKLQIKPIAPCLMAIIVDCLGFGLVYPVITIIFANSSSSILPPGIPESTRYLYLSLGYLLFPLFTLVGSSFLGDLSDKLGRKKVLILCMAGLGISYGLMAVGVAIPNLTLFFFGRAFSGLMAGSQPIAQAAVADLSTPETKTLNMSILGAVVSFGLIVGPLLGGVFSDAKLSWIFTLSTPLYVALILAVVALFWVYYGFKNTYAGDSSAKFHPLRPIHIFIEAGKDKRVRIVALVLFLMQFGFGIYFQLILVILQNQYGYQNWQLGVFNGYLGVTFAFAVLVVLRWIVHLMRIEYLTSIMLFLTAIFQIASAFAFPEWLIWTLALPVGVFDMIAYSGMLTSFSNTATKNRQGWVMGVCGAVVALGWVASGASANLISVISTRAIVCLGGVLIFFSSIIMALYCKKLIPPVQLDQDEQ